LRLGAVELEKKYENDFHKKNKEPYKWVGTGRNPGCAFTRVSSLRVPAYGSLGHFEITGDKEKFVSKRTKSKVAVHSNRNLPCSICVFTYGLFDKTFGS
jgi:hypothetical protein